jgi:hypothetical protein
VRRPSAGSRRVVAVFVVAAACGGDDSGPAPGQPGGAPAPAPPPPAATGPTTQLPKRLHVEDRVEAAEEKATIRYQFHDRDFTDVNRDTFTSSSLIEAGSGAGSGNQVVAKVVECHSRIVAQNYSYADLKLVGIVHQGIQNKVLMMDPGNLGRIITTGECVGKEKAVVEEITQNHVTFLVTPEGAPGQGSTRQPERHSIQLHEHDLDTAQPGDLSQPTPDVEVTPVTPAAGRNGEPAETLQPAPSRR